MDSLIITANRRSFALKPSSINDNGSDFFSIEASSLWKWQQHSVATNTSQNISAVYISIHYQTAMKPETPATAALLEHVFLPAVNLGMCLHRSKTVAEYCVKLVPVN